ncbi:hypothetical protein [Synechococcus sp. MIT S9508]|nr:hypothetical protein [Synechococcus sp. MIT S9508]
MGIYGRERQRFVGNARQSSRLRVLAAARRWWWRHRCLARAKLF